jgi:hypothetical protein
MTREQTYKEQLRALEIYDPAFDPEISTLAQCERQLSRAMKDWSATAPKGGKASVLDPHYKVIQDLRKEILQHREALGLTPKALRKLKGAYYETQRIGEMADQEAAENVTVLDLVREKYAL